MAVLFGVLAGGYAYLLSLQSDCSIEMERRRMFRRKQKQPIHCSGEI